MPPQTTRRHGTHGAAGLGVLRLDANPDKTTPSPRRGDFTMDLHNHNLVPPTRTWLRRWPSVTLAMLLTALLAVFLLAPLGLAIAQGFVLDGKFSLEWFGRILTRPRIHAELLNSLKLACVTTLACLVVAVPMAILRSRCRFRGQGLLGAMVLVPLILPPFVGAIFMKQFLARYGILNLILDRVGLIEMYGEQMPPDWLSDGGFWGTVVLQALHLFPILYLNASAALANIDPTYSQAARNLGAGPWRSFWRITLPLMAPGLFAGGTIVFIWSFTDIGTPAMIGYNDLTAVHIFKDLAVSNLSPGTFSLVFIMLSASVSLYVLGKFLFARGSDTQSSKASLQAQTRPLGLLGTAGAWLLFGAVTAAAVLPHVGVVLNAFSAQWFGTILPTEYTLDHMQAVFTSEDTYQSILNSLRYAGVSTAVDLVLGTLAAWLIVRSRVPGRTALDGLTMLPLAVPGLILAAGYVALTAPGTALEAIGPTKDPFYIIVIAYSVRRLPFVVRSVSAGLEQVPLSLEEAARNLGSSRVGSAVRITLPLITANLLAAGVLTFTFAVLEVSDSLILAQVSTDFPITKKIYQLATQGSPDAVGIASALGVYGMLLLGGTMTAASLLLGKKLGAIFRA